MWFLFRNVTTTLPFTRDICGCTTAVIEISIIFLTIAGMAQEDRTTSRIGVASAIRKLAETRIETSVSPLAENGIIALLPAPLKSTFASNNALLRFDDGRHCYYSRCII